MTAMWEKSALHPKTSGEPDQVALARAFERFNDEVRQAVPAERLLVWSAANGWEPLCEFLEVPVPPAPLPRLNDSKTFTDRIIGRGPGRRGRVVRPTADRWRQLSPRLTHVAAN